MCGTLSGWPAGLDVANAWILTTLYNMCPLYMINQTCTTSFVPCLNSVLSVMSNATRRAAGRGVLRLEAILAQMGDGWQMG